LSASNILAHEPKKEAFCTNQFIFPNADLDNYELPLTGKIKQIETQEIDLVDHINSDLIETTNFDERGRVVNTFLTSSKIKVFGKEVYAYDPKSRLILVVSYNPDGSAVLEDVFTYDSIGNLKQKITRNAKTKAVIWSKEFSYPAGSEYSEFFDKRHGFGFRYKKDNRCRLIEVTSYDLDRPFRGKVLVTYDDEKNNMDESVYSPEGNLIDKKKAEFEFDKKGNWIKKTHYDLHIVDGKPVLKPAVIIQRKIIYYDPK
jgi:hypothetical protein